MNEWESLTAGICTGPPSQKQKLQHIRHCYEPFGGWSYSPLSPKHTAHSWEVPLGAIIDRCLHLFLLEHFILTDQFGQLCSLK